MNSIKEENRINIQLNNPEALVLLDWLARFNEGENNHFEDQAEQRVLWNLEALLEKKVSEIFSDNYLDALKKARESVRDEA